jgi:hypothetical protein
MLQSKINDMFSINKELNMETRIKGCNGCHPSHTIDAVKNPAYKSINSSQTINATPTVIKK